VSTVPKKLLPLMEKGNGNVGSLKRAALCELFSSWCLNSEADHLTSESLLFGVSSRLFFLQVTSPKTLASLWPALLYATVSYHAAPRPTLYRLSVRK
jgi:hypothetical protein